MTPLLFGLILASALPADLANAERLFEQGVNSRADAAAARPLFAQSALAFDELWRNGHRNPSLARNRARAHRLAGNLPAAIAALHEGLAVARYNRSLQVELEDARSAIGYPHDDLAEQCRPRPIGGIGTRMSALEAYLAAGGLWLLACLGAARFAMTRAPAWLFASGIALLALATLGGFWWHDHDRQSEANARPLLIVKDDSALKLGNGESWPDRVKWKLPRGVEVRELARRGGWIQVELASGTVGWLPETNAIPVS